MNPENISKLENSIQKLRDKQSRIYLLAQDTKGITRRFYNYP